MKPRFKSMIWNKREQKTTNQNKKKKEVSKSSLWDNFERSNICIIGMSELEEKEQEIGNLFEKNNKSKLP